MPDMSTLVRQSFLNHLYELDVDMQQRYVMYREYYNGQHPTKLSRRQQRILEVAAGVVFRLNYCPIVIDSLAERLLVTGFDAGKKQSAQFWDWWEANRMDGVQNNVHLASVRDGDTFVIVEWDFDEERPTFTLELAYDGSDGVKIHYSDERRGIVSFASKKWVITDPSDDAGNKRRLNLYYPDRIEKYESNDKVERGNWTPYTDDVDPRWPIPWTTTNAEGGDPLGVPMMHFAYKSGGYNYGKSRMVDVIPPQNSLNKAAIDLATSADYDAFSVMYAFGSGMDELGSVKTAPGSLITSEDSNSKVGRIDAGDLTSLLAYKNDIIMDIARVSNTPLSRMQLSGQLASEGTLKQQEAGLVADAESTQTAFGNSWEDVMGMGRKLHNVFGEGGMDETQTISTEWKQAAVRDETELIERLGVMGEKLHIPDVVLWRRAGMTEDEIKAALADPQYQARLAMQATGLLLNEDNREN